jgi:hypothetical protein
MRHVAAESIVSSRCTVAVVRARRNLGNDLVQPSGVHLLGFAIRFPLCQAVYQVSIVHKPTV